MSRAYIWFDIERKPMAESGNDISKWTTVALQDLTYLAMHPTSVLLLLMRSRSDGIPI